jgi:hypothetical protein
MSDAKAVPDGTELLWTRVCLVIVIAGLLVSGVTAFPLREEVTLGSDLLHAIGAGAWAPGLFGWVDRVADALVVTGEQYPFLAYGTDWLAFAHILIAIAFIGPLRDPVRNIWVIQWGLIACVGIVPLALIAGSIRGLPLGWQLIDISFGVIAAIPLTAALVLTRRIERRAH